MNPAEANPSVAQTLQNSPWFLSHLRASSPVGDDSTEQLGPTVLVTCANLLLQRGHEVCRMNQLPARTIANWLRDPEQQGFQFLDVFNFDSEIDAEMIPGLVMAILEMRLESAHQVFREPDVLQLVSAIKRVDSVPALDQTPHDVMIFNQSIPGDALKILSEEKSNFPLRSDYLSSHERSSRDQVNALQPVTMIESMIRCNIGRSWTAR